MKNKTNIAIPVIFASVLSLVLIIAFVRPGARYHLEVLETYGRDNKEHNYYFADLNGDGNSESIDKFQTTKEYLSLIVYNSDKSIHQQFNFHGAMPQRSNIAFFDYDNNGYRECYFFTYSGDSLFLNILEPYSDSEVRRRYIDFAPLKDGEALYTISNLIEDNSDPSDRRLVFTVSAGFNLVPRKMYSYDPETDDLVMTPQAGIVPGYRIYACDIDNDGFLEFYGNTNATGNYRTPVRYPDSTAWLMIFSHNLDYAFPPVSYGTFPSMVISWPVKINGSGTWAFVCHNRGERKEIHNMIQLYSPAGKFLQSVDLSARGIEDIAMSYVVKNQIYVVDHNTGTIHVFDTRLHEVRKIRSSVLANRSFSGPLRAPGINGQILFSSNRNMEVEILDVNGRKLADTPLNGKVSFMTSSPVQVKNYKGFSGYYIDLEERSFLFSLENRHRWLLFTVKVLGVILLVNTLVQILQYYQRKQERKRLAINARLREYQLLAIKKQIDPHFIFNALNAISYMNLKGDMEQSEEYLMKYASLMREVLQQSDKNITTLSAETEFIKKYLLLEELRLGKTFTYSIDLPEDCAKVEIPAMSVYTFVENAIKHGLAGKTGEKVLKLSARRRGSEVEVIVEDNGRGFKPQSNSFTSTGKGLDILRQMFSAFYQLTGRKISYSRSESESGGVMITLVVEI